MIFKRFFLKRIFELIRETMPDFVMSSIIALIPVSFLLSIFEIFGLLMILPVIQIILKPEVVYENSQLNLLYTWIDSPGETIFVVYLLGAIVIFFILKNMVVYWASFRQTRITYDVASRLATLQFQRYLYQPFQYHVNDNSSVLLRKIIEIPYNFTNGIMLPVVQLINEILIALLIITGILLYNSSLFISIILFITPFFILYVRIYKGQLKNVSQEREKDHTEMFKKGRQSIEGFREILLFDKFNYFIPAFKSSVNRFSKAMAHLYHLNSFSPKIIETLAIVCVFGIFLTGVFLEYDIEKLASFLAAFAIAAYRLIPSINKIILCYNNVRSSEFVFDHFQSLEWQPIVDVKCKDAKDEIEPLQFEEEVQLENISFSFNNNGYLFQGVDLKIRKGETIGIMGKSGSGKSTLMNIILGLLPPSTGKIQVDSTEINDINIKSWHKTISYVPQAPVLMEGTIRENIAFGIHPDAIDEGRLGWAIQNSGLSEFIMGLSAGINATIGDRSLNISGGQKQRIAIARALYHNGSILIFDEATSSLDRETEDFLTDSIKRLSTMSYTIIIIAHRMEPLRYCDRIYKIKDGRINDSKKFTEAI